MLYRLSSSNKLFLGVSLCDLLSQVSLGVIPWMFCLCVSRSFSAVVSLSSFVFGLGTEVNFVGCGV